MVRAALERVRRGIDSADNAAERQTTRDRARDALDQTGPLTRLFVHDRGRIVPVTVSDIERLEAEDDYGAIHARGRR